MNEFEIIRRFFTRAPGRPEGLSVGIGDDAAVIRVPAGQELVLAMDSLVSDVHFPAGTPPADIGWKALAVNLSDLAAMGAEPRWATLSLTLPEVDERWLQDFSSGFFELADRFHVDLIGGDLCRGPLSITVQTQGLIPSGSAITRAGARPGDGIYVSGTLGDAVYGLSEAAAASPDRGYFRNRLDRPQPRVELGMALRDIVTSAIDISDGLVSDLGHILDASGVGATIRAGDIPVSRQLIAAVGEREAVRSALSAGDDYELCVTVPGSGVNGLLAACREHDVPIRCIGTVTSPQGLAIKGIDVRTAKPVGYRHFD